MPHSYLVFDFGSNEEAAQQARLRVEGWKQAFRLDKKLLVKFSREESAEGEQGEPDNKKTAKKDAGPNSQAVGLIVRLDFSEHERLSHQRWLERIPTEALFKDAHPKVIRQGDADFTATAERFEALD
jgi:hypothetical protein